MSTVALKKITFVFLRLLFYPKVVTRSALNNLTVSFNHDNVTEFPRIAMAMITTIIPNISQR